MFAQGERERGGTESEVTKRGTSIFGCRAVAVFRLESLSHATSRRQRPRQAWNRDKLKRGGEGKRGICLSFFFGFQFPGQVVISSSPFCYFSSLASSPGASLFLLEQQDLFSPSVGLCYARCKASHFCMNLSFSFFGCNLHGLEPLLKGSI